MRPASGGGSAYCSYTPQSKAHCRCCGPLCVCHPRMKETDVWGQCEVLRILQRYRPQSEDELFDILSVLDASLVSPHPLVMAATLSLFLSLCSGLPAVCLAALERVRGTLLAACGSVSREMRFTALCHIQVSKNNSYLKGGGNRSMYVYYVHLTLSCPGF